MEPHDQHGSSNLIFVFLGVFFVLTLISWSERALPDLKHIPTLGRQGYLLSYIDALKLVFKGPTLLQRSYETYRPGVFKVSTLHRWLVVVTGTQLIEELRKVPEQDLSFAGVAHEADIPLLHPGHGHSTEPEDISALTRHITQSLPFMLPAIREEIVDAFRSTVTSTQDGSAGWVEIDPVDLVLRVVTRTNNRLFFGVAFSRNVEYASLSALVGAESFAAQFSFFSNLLPSYESYSICKYFFPSFRNRQRLRKLFTAKVHERMDAKDHYETTSDDNVLSWILKDDANVKRPSVGQMASHLFELNDTATQIISTNFLHVLYYLSANPNYASPMRKEIDSIVAREGWTKSSLDKMHKVDSFVKESMRMSGMPSVSMIRKAHKDITLSDGTLIPSGTVLAAAAHARHLDNRFHVPPASSARSAAATSFDGFRFSKPLQEQLEEQQSHDIYRTSTSITINDTYKNINNTIGGLGSHTPFQLVTSTTSFLAWGYGGRHACPGRFYAAGVMKMLLAHVVLGYDVRFEEGVRPGDVVRGVRRMPAPGRKMLLRKR